MGTRESTSSDDAVIQVDLDLEAVELQSADKSTDLPSNPERLTASGGGPIPFQMLPNALEVAESPATALAAAARLMGIMSELVQIRSTSQQLAISAVAASARLGSMMSELIAIRTELRRRCDLLAGRLAGLFNRRSPAPDTQTLAPYAAISPGVRIGFDPQVRADLARPASDSDPALADTCRTLLQISLNNPGTWLSIEAQLDARMLSGGRHYAFAMGARLDRDTDCKLLIRFPHAGGSADVSLGELKLNPLRTTYALAGNVELPDVTIAAPVFIIIFSPREPKPAGERAMQIALGRMSLHVT